MNWSEASRRIIDPAAFLLPMRRPLLIRRGLSPFFHRVDFG
jgi:hypothetical protein